MGRAVLRRGQPPRDWCARRVWYFTSQAVMASRSSAAVFQSRSQMTSSFMVRMKRSTTKTKKFKARNRDWGLEP